MILQKLIKLFYRTGLVKKYWEVDRGRYLKRIDKRKLRRDEWYYDDQDAAQFRSSEVLARSVYKERALFFQCDRRSDIENKIIQRGLFDRTLIDLMLDFAKPNSIIADVGANMGAYTVPLAKMAPFCSVHAFEPNPLMVERLRRNLALNQLSNVVIHEIGVSDAHGEETLYAVTEGNQGASSFIPYSIRNEKTRPIPVIMETLDHIFFEQNQPVSLIKIDVQGFELNVLKGALNILKQSKPCVIFEYERDHFSEPGEENRVKKELDHLFNENHYQVYYISPKFGPSMLAAVRWESLSRCNLLAVPMSY